jgi:hypothetical protein
VLSVASAVAIIDLEIEENLSTHSVYGDDFSALATAARNYIALTVQAGTVTLIGNLQAK